MEFGKNLQALRKAKKMSQEELAGELNVSRQAVGKWESGTVYPDAERLIQIGDYFGVSLDLLLKGNGEPETGRPPQMGDGGSEAHSPLPIGDSAEDRIPSGSEDGGAEGRRASGDGDGEKASSVSRPHTLARRNRNIRFIAGFALILISPFLPGEPGNGTMKSFLMLLCVIGGLALLAYNYLSRHKG